MAKKMQEIKNEVVRLFGTKLQYVTFERIEEQTNGWRAEIKYLGYRYVIVQEGEDTKVCRKVV